MFFYYRNMFFKRRYFFFFLINLSGLFLVSAVCKLGGHKLMAAFT